MFHRFYFCIILIVVLIAFTGCTNNPINGMKVYFENTSSSDLFKNEKPRIYIPGQNETFALFSNLDGAFFISPNILPLNKEMIIIHGKMVSKCYGLSTYNDSILLIKKEIEIRTKKNSVCDYFRLKGKVTFEKNTSIKLESIMIHVIDHENTEFLDVNGNFDFIVNLYTIDDSLKRSLKIAFECKSVFFKLYTIQFDNSYKFNLVEQYEQAKPVEGIYQINIDSTRIKYIDSFVQKENVLKNILNYKTNLDTILTTDTSGSYSNIIFFNTLYSSKDTFSYPISFDSSHFTHYVDFSNIVFEKTVSFNGTQFFGGVGFNGSKFLQGVSFSSCYFNSDADFSDVTFLKCPSFQYATMPKYLNLENVTIPIGGEIDLSSLWKINKNEVCNINLFRTDIDRINLMYTDFSLNINGDGTSFLVNNRDQKSALYQKLLSKTNQKGYLASYEKLDKEFKEFKYLEFENNQLWFKFTNWLNKNWWGYGYDKELIIRNTFFIFIFFVFINIFILRKLASDVYLDKKIVKSLNSKELFPISIMLKRIPLSVYYTSIIFFPISINLKKLRYERNLKGIRVLWMFYFGLMFVSGLVCIGYLANFVITGGA